MNKFFYSLFITLLVVSFGIAQEKPVYAAEKWGNDGLETGNVVQVKIDTSQTFQTIHNFGASDAWSIQFVGKNWPDATKNQMVDLLFSKEFKKDGSPKGIALSAWRFNIGAGSREQGEASGIKDEWRRAECFINESGKYDWSAQSGQIWFLNQASKKGVANFVGFVNSPPVFFTRNKKAWSDDGESANISGSNYQRYANFLTEVIKGIKGLTNIKLDYISPFNEPQWKWKCCNQEGSPWNNDEIAAMTKVLDDSFNQSGLETKIELTEAGQINYLFDDFKNEKRGDQINQFFNPSSKNYLGNLNRVAKKVVGHSYFSTWPTNQLIENRKSLAERLKDVDPALEFGMSEYTLLENNEEIKGKGRDLGMDPALYMARVIHADLVFANATFWHWWLAVSPYNYKDGLIYIDKNKQKGAVFESKMLWTLGHYSRFIRPGMVRIGIDSSFENTIQEQIQGLLFSAYQSKSKDKLVIVFTNQLNEEKVVQLSGLPKRFEKMKVYQTSDSHDDNLTFKEKVLTSGKITIPKRSLITCVIEN